MKHKRIISTLASGMLLFGVNSYASDISYTVQKGDSYWIIANKFNIDCNKLLSANNAQAGDVIEVGQRITVPSNTYTVQKGDTYYLIAKKCNVSTEALLKANGNGSDALNVGDIIKFSAESSPNTNIHTVQKGDTYWTISRQYNAALSDILSLNGAKEGDVLYIGDTVKIPSKSTVVASNYITYQTYTVKENDTLWNIAIKCKIPFEELLKANNLTESTYIYSGMKLTYPVHHIAQKTTLGDNYGELLDWFGEAQYVVPIGTDFKVVDFETKKSFNARRTVGSGHADCEPLTVGDTKIMKEIWGGLNWNKRSVIVVVNGRKIAASAASAMHAGNDYDPGGYWTSYRSGNYGGGINYDYIKGNGADGHFDLYFYNSIGHSSAVINEAHQRNILRSAGQQT